jgi:hypothetical protein
VIVVSADDALLRRLPPGRVELFQDLHVVPTL